MNKVISFISDNDINLQHSEYKRRHNISKSIYFIDEIWVDIYINNIQPWYMVSSYGRVYSKINQCLLRTTTINSGYEKISLRTMYNDKQDFLIHILVAIHFIENDNPTIKNQVNHIDGLKYHNHYANLEWVTQNDNMKHAYEIGLRKIGEDHNFAKFTNEQVHLICKGLEKRMSYKDICEKVLELEYNDAIKVAISSIKIGRNWKHISRLYNIPNTNRNYQLLVDDDIHFICKCLENGLSNKQIINMLNIDNPINIKGINLIINRIKRHDRFTRISKNYNF